MIDRRPGPAERVEMRRGATGGCRSLNILMVSARFAPFVGGTEIHTGQVAGELSRRGHRLTVLTTDLSGSLPRRDRVGEVQVIRVPAFPPRTDLYLAPGLWRVITRGSWDLIHVQGYHTAVAPVALAAARKAGIPTVLTFHSGGHSSRIRNMIRPLQVRMLRRSLLGADRLFGVSEFEADLFTRRLGIEPGRIRVIPNGVSPAEPSPGNRHREGPRPAPSGGTGSTILSVGRLVRYKGHHRVIHAMPRILELEPDTRLLILGQGPYEKDLRKLVRRLKLGDHVEFDYVPSDQPGRLRDMLRDASLAVLLSDYESHGMAAHEALTVGLPLAVMDKTALSELVTSGLAQAIPPQATDREVAEIVARCLRRPADTAFGEARTHTWSAITDRLEQQYFDVVEPRTGSTGVSGTLGRR